MSWLYFLLVGLFIWSATSLVDRHALSGRVKSKSLYTLLPSFVHLPIVSVIILFFGGLGAFSIEILVLALLAGFLEVSKLHFMFKALSVEGIVRAFPLGSFSSFLVLFLSWFLLQDPLKGKELWAFLIFVAGGFLLALKYGKGGRISVSEALKPMLVCASIGAFEIIVLKAVFNSTGFWTGLYLSRIGLFLGGVFLLGFKLRGEVAQEWKSLGSRFRGLLVGNQGIAVFGHVFFYFAIKLENAALVSSAGGIQHGMIFVMASLISYWRPDILKEDLSRWNLTQKALGIIFVILAIYLLNI